MGRKCTIADRLVRGSTEVVHAWVNRRSLDHSLAARVLCISHNRWLRSHRPGRRSDPAGAAFRQTRLSKRSNHGGNNMKSSIANRLVGELHEAKGSFKEKVGRMTKDTETESEGLTEKIVGKIQKKIGRAQKAIAKR